MANRTDLYIEGKFWNEADPKDGYPVRDCRDERERRVLEFLVPIVHPDKPTRVTRTLGNTIFGALSGDRTVDWAIIFMELVNRLVGGWGRPSPPPYVLSCITSMKARAADGRGGDRLYHGQRAKPERDPAGTG